jgi:hypothetical protein
MYLENFAWSKHVLMYCGPILANTKRRFNDKSEVTHARLCRHEGLCRHKEGDALSRCGQRWTQSSQVK